MIKGMVNLGQEANTKKEKRHGLHAMSHFKQLYSSLWFNLFICVGNKLHTGKWLMKGAHNIGDVYTQAGWGFFGFFFPEIMLRYNVKKQKDNFWKYL